MNVSLSLRFRCRLFRCRFCRFLQVSSLPSRLAAAPAAVFLPPARHSRPLSTCASAVRGSFLGRALAPIPLHTALLSAHELRYFLTRLSSPHASLASSSRISNHPPSPLTDVPAPRRAQTTSNARCGRSLGEAPRASRRTRMQQLSRRCRLNTTGATVQNSSPFFPGTTSASRSHRATLPTET